MYIDELLQAEKQEHVCKTSRSSELTTSPLVKISWARRDDNSEGRPAPWLPDLLLPMYVGWEGERGELILLAVPGDAHCPGTNWAGLAGAIRYVTSRNDGSR